MRASRRVSRRSFSAFSDTIVLLARAISALASLTFARSAAVSTFALLLQISAHSFSVFAFLSSSISFSRVASKPCTTVFSLSISWQKFSVSLFAPSAASISAWSVSRSTRSTSAIVSKSKRASSRSTTVIFNSRMFRRLSENAFSSSAQAAVAAASATRNDLCA